MKGLFIALTIVAIAICAPISLTFQPTVNVNLDDPQSPFIEVSNLPGDDFNIALGTCTNFVDSGNDKLRATFAGFAELMNCGFKQKDDGEKRNLHKRGFVPVGTKQEDDHDVFENLLTITNPVGSSSTLKMAKNIELWFPKNLLLVDDIAVTDNGLVSTFALTSLTFDHGDDKWTVTIEFNVQSPYRPTSTVPTAPSNFIDRTHSFSAVTGNGPYTFDITVGTCSAWTASGKISIPSECIPGQPLCIGSTPANIEIDVSSIATASACPVTQVFDFRESIQLYVVSGIDAQPAQGAEPITVLTTPIKVSDYVYIKLVNDDAPANVIPTFSFTRACVKKKSDAKALCGANSLPAVQPAGRDATVLARDLFTAYQVLTGSQGHAETFDVVAEFSVTYTKGTTTTKRNIVVRSAVQGITIENVEIHSSASVFSFVPLLLAAIAVFLA